MIDLQNLLSRICFYLLLLLLITAQAAATCCGADQEDADGKASKSNRTVMRRLTRVEYEHTVRDLLRVHLKLQDILPPDSAAGAFDNVGEAMHMSSFLMERYLEAADKALGVAIANAPRPPLVKKRYSLKDERAVEVATESVYLQRDDSLIMFSSSAWNAITVGQFYPPDRGAYRIRVSAYGFQSGDRPVTFRVDAGPMLMGTKNELVGYFDAQPRLAAVGTASSPGSPQVESGVAQKSTVIEFLQHFEARDHFRISPYGLATAQTVNKIGAEQYDGPGLGIDWVEVEGPLFDAWPPESHRHIFRNLEQEPVKTPDGARRLEVVSSDPLADARQILQRFARRAFRRPVSDAEIEPIFDLVKARLDEQRSFEQAVRVGLTAIMVSPDFLFLREDPGPLDDFELASRLSYFLWSTAPDEELLKLAEQGRLTGDAAAEVLRKQCQLMLDDRRAERFVSNFLGQWLGLHDLDFTEPSHLLYPEFDDLLKYSMQRESELFFQQLLKEDLSVANLVDSDFSMLNGRLTKHYGIPFTLASESADGGEGAATFRKVALPANSHRGGVLTMASVLKVTANGTLTSPVMRGVWVLDRMLDQRPAPPPAGVAALEPDIRGSTTIREQLAKHREIEACASCHDDIDPYGFALESFDVIGGWRDYYRTTGNGEPVTVDGRQMHYRQGKPVDPSGTLADGREFRNVDELKRLLLEDRDQIARALTNRLLTYATGAEPQASDEAEIELIVAKARERNYGLRSLLQEIVASPLFRSK